MIVNSRYPSSWRLKFPQVLLFGGWAGVRAQPPNHAFIERELPELRRLLVSSVDEVLASSEVIVLAGSGPEFEADVRHLKRNQILIDLMRLSPAKIPPRTRWHGLCW